MSVVSIYHLSQYLKSTASAYLDNLLSFGFVTTGSILNKVQ